MNYLALLMILLGAVLGGCQKPVLRREIRELNDTELKIYVNAVNKLHKTMVPGKNYTYIGHFAKIHGDYIKLPHAKPPFLVWHRHLVRLYEMELQKIDPRVVMTYWDWTLDSQAPERSHILSSKYFGGNGKRAKNYCVTDGSFQNWNLNIPNVHCLTRQYNLGDGISPFATPEEIHLYLNEPKYSDLSLLFEEKHACVHNFIGGDLQGIHSPNDPLFFLHHTFIDLIFHNWQMRHPKSPYDGNRHYQSANFKDELVPFGIKAKDTWDINHPRYCYNYCPYPRVVFKDVSPSEQQKRLKSLKANNPILYGPLYNKTLPQALQLLPDLIKKATALRQNISLPYLPAPYHEPLKFPSYFPSGILRQIGFNLTEFRANVQDSNHLIELLNQYPDYVSMAHIGSLVSSSS